MESKITKLQDSDGHWYWIPNDLVDAFNADEQELSGKDYMDCPDLFDTFSDNYEQYRTGGSPDLMPDIFASTPIEVNPTNINEGVKVEIVYQELFNHLNNEHNLTLLESEMQEIILLCKKFYLPETEPIPLTENQEIEKNFGYGDSEFEIQSCEVCFQMTNHLNGVCQKCKPLESVSVEEAANDLRLRGSIIKHPDPNTNVFESGIYQGFIAGANWQKSQPSQTDALLVEAVELLKDSKIEMKGKNTLTVFDLRRQFKCFKNDLKKRFEFNAITNLTNSYSLSFSDCKDSEEEAWRVLYLIVEKDYLGIPYKSIEKIDAFLSKYESNL